MTPNDSTSPTVRYKLSPEEEDRLVEAEFQDVLAGYLSSKIGRAHV